jgi:protein-tyrosine kinase
VKLGKSGRPPAANGAPEGNGSAAAANSASPDSAARNRRAAWWRAAWGRRNGKAGSHSDLLVEADDGSPISEQFRVLRTRIEMTGPGLYMLTSALDQEGKTLCAANLAIALSMSVEARVLLLDADLRHPSIGSRFGGYGRKGLVDCLEGRADWRDCIESTPHDGVSILPAGARSSLAPELLGSDRMGTIIAELRSEFPHHFLIFDAPPILLTADPLVLARHMDRVLLVVRAGVTPRAAVTKAVEILGPEVILGVIFNDATVNFSHRYYYAGRYPYAARYPYGARYPRDEE